MNSKRATKQKWFSSRDFKNGYNLIILKNGVIVCVYLLICTCVGMCIFMWAWVCLELGQHYKYIVL